MKKLMWRRLADELNATYNLRLTPTEVESRYKCVMKRHRKAIDNNGTSGNVYKETGFEAETNLIVAMDDSLSPDFLLASGLETGKSLNIETSRLCTNPSLLATASSSSATSSSLSGTLEPTTDSDGRRLKRKEKTPHQVLSEQMLVISQERNEMISNFIKENQQGKEEKQREKNERTRAKRECDRLRQQQKHLRHLEKMDILK